MWVDSLMDEFGDADEDIMGEMVEIQNNQDHEQPVKTAASLCSSHARRTLDNRESGPESNMWSSGNFSSVDGRSEELRIPLLSPKFDFQPRSGSPIPTFKPPHFENGPGGQNLSVSATSTNNNTVSSSIISRWKPDFRAVKSDVISRAYHNRAQYGVLMNTSGELNLNQDIKVTAYGGTTVSGPQILFFIRKNLIIFEEDI